MHTRRAHHKSRSGCEACKRRRIKVSRRAIADSLQEESHALADHPQCDEQRPECTQCAVRGLDCVFSEPVRGRSAGVQSNTATVADTNTPATASASYSPPAAQAHAAVADNRLLELELMHQWSTSTYKSMVERPEDFATAQVLVPQIALKHEFLLYVMFAAASLEIAMTPEKVVYPAYYFDMALKYQSLAMTSFRAMTEVTESNHFAVFNFSLITMVLTLAVPQYERSSLVQSVVVHYELLRQMGGVIAASLSWLSKGPFQNSTKPLEEAPVELIHTNDRIALERLTTINEQRNEFGNLESRAAKLKAMSYHAASRKAIFQLEEMFAHCTKPHSQGIMLAWLNLAGPEYVQAVKDSEPVALLVMMHWGVLAHRAGNGYWWIEKAGRNLVAELSGLLVAADDHLMIESIAWAHEQVGLDMVDHYSQNTTS
jgi:hypothetical protein